MPRSFFNIEYLQGSAAAGATINGNGIVVDAGGIDSATQVEILETAGGTATVTLQGSFDGTHWYSVGYQQVDATVAPARAVSAISVAANSGHVYQVLDPYPLIQAVVSSVAGASIIARVYNVGS